MDDDLPRLPARRALRAALAVVLLVIPVLFAAMAWWRETRLAAGGVAPPPPPLAVTAVTARPESLPQALEATGALTAVRAVTLAPEVAGRVVAIRFEAGMAVEAGAPLVQLYDAPERAERAEAVARARFARIQLERSRALAPFGAEPRQTLQQREAELAQAEAALQGIDARLAQKSVRAPFAGLIGLRRVNPGQYVTAGEALASLTALDRLYVDFTVPQQHLAALRPGAEVSVRTDAYPERDFAARINAIEPVIGQDTRAVGVQAVLDNPDRLLRPGLYVTVAVALAPRPAALLVPATALVTSAAGDSVLVVRDGRAEAVAVAAGPRRGERVVIDQGLAPGDVVVTGGQVRIRPGAAVRVLAAPDPAAPAAR
ncbi:MAG: hypothetical protein RLZZ501_322 [Pseudomonadota bacterium]